MTPEAEYIRHLEDVICDILDGDDSWWDIQYFTGLDEDRCKEISTLYNDILKKNVKGGR